MAVPVDRWPARAPRGAFVAGPSVPGLTGPESGHQARDPCPDGPSGRFPSTRCGKAQTSPHQRRCGRQIAREGASCRLRPAPRGVLAPLRCCPAPCTSWLSFLWRMEHYTWPAQTGLVFFLHSAHLLCAASKVWDAPCSGSALGLQDDEGASPLPAVPSGEWLRTGVSLA